MRGTFSMLACALALVAAPPAQAHRADEAAEAAQVAAPTCKADDLVDVPGQGPSCKVSGGWLLPLADGTTVFTTGPDPVPVAVPYPALSQPGTNYKASDPYCVTSSSEYAIKAIYAYPSDKGSRATPTNLAQWRTNIREMNGRLNEAGLEAGGKAVNARVMCDANGVIAIDVLSLANVTSLTDTYTTITAGLRAAGYTSTTKKYVVFWDDQVAPFCGQGAGASTDDSASVSNANNTGGHFAIVYDAVTGCKGGGITLHELTHAFGHVLPTAPPSPHGDGHCNDGDDTMCYKDAGSAACPVGDNGNTECVNTCFDYEHYDCNHDTYFHTAPAGTNWLSNHWNLGATYFRYFRINGDNCGLTAPVVVFQDDKFNGGCLAFSANDADLSNNTYSNGASANVSITGVKVAPGYTVQLFAGASFAGSSATFDGLVSWVGTAWNDLARSIRVDQCRQTAPVVLYKDNSFTSPCKAFTANDSTLVGDTFSDGIGMNDGTTGVRLSSGWLVTLFQDANYGGATKDLVSSTTLLETGWNDAAGALKIAAQNAPCDLNQPVVLYENNGFLGGCKAMSANDPLFTDNLLGNSTGLNDRVSSIRVKPGWAVRIYQNTNFGGTSIEFSTSMTFVGTTWNDFASSATIRCISVC